MKRKLFFAALTAAVTLLSGCDDTPSESVFDEAKAFVREGDYEAAEQSLLKICRDSPSGEACGRYLSVLDMQGKLDFLKDNFPPEDGIVFKGKPLSGYEEGELYQMALPDDRIGYQNVESYSDSVYFYGGDESVLPYGITGDMSYADILCAVGFSEEQAEALTGVFYVSIDLSGESPVFDVKKSVYTPFSQHPPEMYELRIRRENTELCFKSYGDRLEYYAVTVYF